MAPSGFVVIVGGVWLTARRPKAAWREGYLRACVKRCRRLGHVGTLFSHAIIEQALAVEPAHRASGHIVDDTLEIVATWRLGGVEAGRSAVEREDTVEPDDVEMGIQVEAPTEALNTGDGAGPWGRES